MIKESKFQGLNWWIILIIPILLSLLFFADSFSENQATIIGIIGSVATSFLILLATLNIEKRANLRSGKKSALILYQVLNSAHAQIQQITNGLLYPVVYPENWIEYYKDCAIYLEYDYLEYLLFEFSIIKKLNESINDKDKARVNNLLESRKKLITDSTNDFDIFTVRLNLLLFASNSKEAKSWKQEKEYIQFSSFFRMNYSKKVKELTVEYLKKSNSKCNNSDAMFYVLNELKKIPNYPLKNIAIIYFKIKLCIMKFLKFI